MSAARPDSPQWLAAKGKGNAAELAVAEWYKRRGYEVTQTIGKAGFDLLVQMRVEVKRDLLSRDTGNIAIEVSYDGKPSGIMNTEADTWVIAQNGIGFIANAARLREVVKKGDFEAKDVGDQKRATVKLIPVEKFRAFPFVREIRLR